MNVKVTAEEDAVTKAQLVAEWELHKRKAERAYQQLKEDTASSVAREDTDLITFDLQQSLATPALSTNVIFYKRQLWTYNLGVHCGATGVGYMHMWNECVASRGSQEVGSCVLRHLQESVSTAKHLIAFSDVCGGQNRNINIVCFWLYIVASPNLTYERIDHKFMISGHSYLPNDRDFGSIETARRKTQHIFVPEDWCDLVQNARRKNPFVVRRMSQDNIVSIDKVVKEIVNRKTNTDGNKVEWLRILWIRVEQDHPYTFKYRYSHNELEEWKVINLQKRQRGRPANLGTMTLDPLYSGPRPINRKKLDDLRQLLDFVPPVFHAFFLELISSVDETAEHSD